MQDAQPAQSIAGVFTPRLVARLHREGFDGSLRLGTEGTTRVIYFRNGEIASAASNAEADRLPNILLGDGRLTEPQLEMARSRLQPGVSLGKMLIEMGFLTPSELLQGARRQVRQILAACFALHEGTFQITPGPLPREVTVLGLPARRLIFDALMESGDRQAIVREMGSMESVYRPTEALHEGLTSLRLETSSEQVGLTVNGQRTLREISSQTSLDDFTVSKIVLALEILGLVEPEPSGAAASAPPQARVIPVEVELPPEPQAGPYAPPEEPEIVTTPRHEPERPETQPPPAPPAAVEDLDAQPPPFPPGELPAFAVPPGAMPEWRLDPETGVKTMAGPVEMTFDGQVGPPTRRPSAARRWAVLASVAAVVLIGALAGSMLRGRRSQQEEVAGTTTSAAESAADSGRLRAPEPQPAEAHPPAPVEAGQADTLKATSPPAQATPPPAQASPPPARPRPVPPEAAPAAGVADESTEHLAPASGTRPGQEKFADAYRLIEKGRVAEGADAFRALVREKGRNRFTLQVLIACEPATVQKALAATRAAGDLIVVPFPLQGRTCFRACWGLYDSKEAAHAAASSVPDYFSEGAQKPVVVSLARLAPQS